MIPCEAHFTSGTTPVPTELSHTWYSVRDHRTVLYLALGLWPENCLIPGTPSVTIELSHTWHSVCDHRTVSYLALRLWPQNYLIPGTPSVTTELSQLVLRCDYSTIRLPISTLTFRPLNFLTPLPFRNSFSPIYTLRRSTNKTAPCMATVCKLPDPLLQLPRCLPSAVN